MENDHRLRQPSSWKIKLSGLLILSLLIGAAMTGSHPRESGAAPGFVAAGLIYEPTPELPSAHASTVAPMPDGSILCAWYSGTAEAAPDVAVYASRYQDGRWSRPAVIADTPGKPEGNPVLFVDATDRVWLFFVTIHGLGWNWAKIKYQTSTDAGHTWGPVQILRDQRGWMTRNHPITLADGRILLPLYSENKWCSEFMVSADRGATWQNLSEVCSKPGNIQPAVVQLADGSLYATMRTGAKKGTGRLWQTRSRDGGKTWSPPELTSLPNPNAGTDMIQLASGKLLLAFNDTNSARTPLSLAVSADDGQTWRKVADVETEPGEYSYPSLCQAQDGTIHLTYTYRRLSIRRLAFTEAWLK